MYLEIDCSYQTKSLYKMKLVITRYIGILHFASVPFNWKFLFRKETFDSHFNDCPEVHLLIKD